MKMVRSFVMMGVAMLAACIALAAPAGAAERMHDPGLYAVAVSVPDVQADVVVLHDAVIAADEISTVTALDIGRSTGSQSPDDWKPRKQLLTPSIDLRLRC